MINLDNLLRSSHSLRIPLGVEIHGKKPYHDVLRECKAELQKK